MFNVRGQSVAKCRRPATRLRLDTFEDRVVPAIGLGVNSTSFGSDEIPAVGNSGAVGPDNYVQFEVGNIVVFDKSGNIVTQEADSQFWMDAGIDSGLLLNGLAMPRVTYDLLTDRWYAVEVTGDPTSDQVLFAQSDSGDPTGTWTGFNYTGINGQYASFPTLGIDANGVYVGTANFLNRDVPNPTGVTLTAIPKADLLDDVNPPTIDFRTTFNQAGPSAMGWAPQVVTNFDPSPTHATVLATHFTLFNKIVRTPLTWSFAGAHPTASLGTSASLTISNSLPGKARQPDGTRQLSGADDDRYAGQIFQVGDLIYAAHGISVNSTGVAATSGSSTTDAVQLIVLSDSQARVVTQSNYFSTNFDYTYGSVAANQFGDIVIGMNRSGSQMADGQLGAYAVYARINTANPGAGVTFGPEIELMAGQTNGYHQQGSSLEAWGPNSAIMVDPSDPLSFWTTQEFAESDVAWSTQVTQVCVAPRAGVVSSTATNGTYGVGATIDITVSFNGPVDVIGTPTLKLNSGGAAEYTDGAGTSTLTFTYTVGPGETTNGGRLDYVSTTPFDLTNGSIQANGVDAELILPAPGAAGSLAGSFNFVIDTAVPTVTGVTAGVPNGTYGFTAVIPIRVTFNRPVVVVTGTPQLALNTGATATYTSGSGTNTLIFTYTVGSGEHTPDLDYTSAAALTGGIIQDQANGSIVTPALPDPGTAGSLGANQDIVIDAVGSVVLNVTSPTANGVYGLGSVVDVTVQFDRAVTVTGSPRLALNTGASATYLSGSGTDTLTFRYTVGAGQSTADLDYASTSALTLNGGTILAGGLGANLTLPGVGGPGSLGGNKNITIDTVGPTVVDFRVLYGTRSYSLLGSTRFDLPWLVTGVQVVFDGPVQTGNIHSLTGVAATRLLGLKTNKLTWMFRGISKGMFNTTLANTGVNALKDKAGNAIMAFAQSFNVLWGDFNDDHVVNALDEAAVRGAQAGPFQPGSTGYNQFADLSGDGIVNLVDVGNVRSRKGTSLP
jgi:hypothetical protein